MKIAIIDNYDSFTYNLFHAVRSFGVEVEVFRNDKFDLEILTNFNKIILSPGPGIPQEAGQLLDVIKTYAATKPMLGVCLGHQAIAEVFGGKLRNLSEVVHGVATPIEIIENDLIFNGLEKEITVGRYHSWVVEKENLPEDFIITSQSKDGEIMSIRHKKFPLHGIQFHPESVLTPVGNQILKNFIS